LPVLTEEGFHRKQPTAVRSWQSFHLPVIAKEASIENSPLLSDLGKVFICQFTAQFSHFIPNFNLFSCLAAISLHAFSKKWFIKLSEIANFCVDWPKYLAGTW
jgi:hypothetical protein